MHDKKSFLFGAGALASGSAAALTALCCIGPIAAGILGTGAAALGARLEPLRPLLIGLTVVFLGFAFYRAYRPLTDCAKDQVCATEDGRRVQRIFLWIAAIVALVFSTAPYWWSLLVYLSL